MSDDVAAGMREALPEPDEVMESEIVASGYADRPAPMTPSAANRVQPGTPGTKRKAAERVGNSATRTRLQFN